MKETFRVHDRDTIEEIFTNAEYGTLSICAENRPYSLPLNFVKIGDEIYFHGSKRGRKIDILKHNYYASFSIVESYSMIDSDFSSKDGLACPATQFFKSLIADGEIEFVQSRDEKIEVLTSLMKKLQAKGGYIPLSEDIYTKAIDATTIYKLKINELQVKYKFGQHLPKKHFEMIVKHLEQRGTKLDIETIKIMKENHNDF